LKRKNERIKAGASSKPAKADKPAKKTAKKVAKKAAKKAAKKVAKKAAKKVAKKAAKKVAKKAAKKVAKKAAKKAAKKVKRSDSQNTFYNKDRIHLRRVPFSNNEIKDWDNLSDVEIVFNPVPWNLNLIQLESVDEKNKIGYLAFEANAMPFTNKKHSVA
jgi:hypothetical protein